MGGQKITQFLREGPRPEELGAYATNAIRSTPLARRATELYETVDPTNLTPERLARTGQTLVEKAYRSALDKVFGKPRKASRPENAVRKYVLKVLAGDNLGAQVNEVSADWLSNLEYVDINIGKRGRSPLGFNENVNGRNIVYIPRVGENVGLVVSRGIQDYIKIHELMETTEAKPKGEREHEKMDAAILSVLKEFSTTSERARQAYRGALSVYEARGENDPYFRGVSKFYPVREEIRSNVFSLNNKGEFAFAA